MATKIRASNLHTDVKTMMQTMVDENAVDSADVSSIVNANIASKTTSDISEGTNLYYTDARVGTYISGDRSYGNITTTGYLRGPSTFTIDPAAHGDNTGTLVVAGNLQVDGTTTTINSTTVAIDDLKLSVATDAASSAAANGAGLVVGGANANITYTHATGSWDFDKPVNVTGAITATGISQFSDVNIPDNNAIRFGNSQDLQIYHDGTDSYITDTTGGNFFINENGAGYLMMKGSDLYFRNPSNADMIHAQSGGYVKLYHNSSQKLATTSTGIDVTGTVTSDGLTVDNELISMAHTGSTSTISLTQKVGTQNSVATISANREDTTTSASRLLFNTNDGTSTLQRMRIANNGDISFYEDTGTTAKFFWDASAESLGIGIGSIGNRPNGLRIDKDNTKLVVYDDGTTNSFFPESSGDDVDLGLSSSRFKDLYLSGLAYTNKVVAQTIFREGADGSGLHFTTNAIYPTDQTSTISNGTESLGASGYRFKDLYLSSSIKNPSGDLTLDASGAIILDADNTGLVDFKDGGTHFGRIENASSDFKLESRIQDKDIVLVGNDGGVGIEALRLDTSDAGTAIFNHDIKLPDNGRAIFGAGSDLQIYHGTPSGGSCIDENGFGNLNLRSINGGSIRLYVGGTTPGDIRILASSIGYVQLYYGGLLKLQTSSTGIDVTGTVTSDGLTVAGNVSVDGGTIKLDGNYPVGTNNVALGDTALDSIASGGTRNTAIGFSAGTALTTQDYNVFVGSYSGDGATGSSNVAVGDVTLRNVSGSFNTAIGGEALNSNTTASNNTAVGYQSLYSNTTASNNTAVGYQAGYNQTDGGLYNTYMGYRTGWRNTGGDFNTYYGYEAGFDNQGGTGNTYIGKSAGYYMDGGHYNTILGGYNGNQDSIDIRTASNRIVIADGDGNVGLYMDNNSQAFFGDMTRQTDGANLNVNATDTKMAGNFYQDNNSDTVLVKLRHAYATGSTSASLLQFCQTNGTEVGTVKANTGGTTYNTTSDRRLKDNIEPISDATDKLMDMKPVTHTWINDPESPQVHGFIAQEMQEIVPEAVSGNAESDEMMSMDYGRITPVIVAALQDALNEIKELKTRINKLENN